MEKTPKRFYTIKEVAGMLRVERMSVSRYIKQGKIKAVRFGKIIRIPEEEISYLFKESK